MKPKDKKTLLRYAVEFVKLQLSGNILFLGTLAGLFVLHELLGWQETLALAIASILAHVLFFLANKEWVFDDKTGKRKTSSEIRRFVIFMGINYFINLGIVTGLSHYYGVSPYIGQIVAAVFFTVWNFVGLRFWVFQEMKHHAIHVKYATKGRKNSVRVIKRA